ncbi:MAG: hypothetical protein EZS28_029457 [Streblomastix strix]|uniref:Uncharacterized protein n=1 Tax=Streblomastix strix TaxID=222440 RepID=A0A5J4UXF9_9EUKA|nr:MAG: hypothetical protein EZS28_029457 [Streblomastix strix]
MSARRRKPKKDITQPIQPKQLRVDSPEHSDPTPIAPESKNESTDLTSSVAVDLTSDKTNEIVEQPFKRNLRPRKQPIKMEKDFVSSDGGDKDDRYNNSASNNEVEDVKQTKKVKSKHTSKSKPKTKQVKKKKKKKQIKSENESSNNQENEEDQEEEQDQQIGPYHPLHHWSRKRIGFHLETGGDLSNPVKNCIGQSVALFLGSNRGWNCRQIKDDEIARFKSSSETRTLQQAEEIKKISKKDQKQEDSEEIEGSDLNPIPFSRLVLPHSTYLVNLATKDNSHFNQSVERLKMELSLSVRLGVGAVNFHPGSTKNELTREKGCQ